MKTLKITLFAFLALNFLSTTAQKTTEVIVLTTSPKKVITREADNYLVLIDPTDFINSIDKISSDLIKLAVSSEDKKALKKYLKDYFNEHDTLSSTINTIPGKSQQAFMLLFIEYLNVTLNKGNYAVYNTVQKSYEKSIFRQVEEVAGNNASLGIKESVKVINEVFTYYTNDKLKPFYVFTNTRTEKK
ncbi:MAG: hypothetical protein IPP64_07945 [Bacteroidetes bacterium]|nr:hypothetical protein [Bacteroidota bacterium]